MEHPAEPGGARRPRRLPDPDDVRADRQFHRQEQRRPRRGLADRQRRIPVRPLSVDFLRRPDRARRRSDPARSRCRHVARGPDLRGHAAADGSGAAADVRRLHSVLVLRPVSARAAQSPRLRLRSGHHPSVLRHRRLLRRADLRFRDLHLPVHPVRLVPRARRHDPAVHRRLARPVRRHPRRTCQGRGVRLGHDGHDFRIGRRQCRHRRPVHDPADDQVRLPPRLRRRRRGHRLDGRADHAAGDGRGRLHHGGDAGRRLLGDRQGRGYSGDAVFRLRILDGASGSRQARPGRHEALGNSERLEGAGGALVPGAAAGGAGLHAVRRFYAALCRHHGAVADGGADPRRQHHARLLLQRASLYLLDRPRAGGRRGIAQRPRYCADRLHHRAHWC